jgi:hypothetical protein
MADKKYKNATDKSRLSEQKGRKTVDPEMGCKVAEVA